MRMKMRPLLLLLQVLLLNQKGEGQSEMTYHSSWPTHTFMTIHHISCTRPLDQPVDYFTVTLRFNSEVENVKGWSVQVVYKSVLKWTFESKRKMYPPRVVLNFHVSSWSTFQNAITPAVCIWNIVGSGPNGFLPNDRLPPSSLPDRGPPGRLSNRGPANRLPLSFRSKRDIVPPGILLACASLNRYFPSVQVGLTAPPFFEDSGWDFSLRRKRGLLMLPPRNPPPSVLSSSWTIDYNRALDVSNQFYKIQRSGFFIPTRDRASPTTWVFSSGMDHMTEDGRDLQGGWYNGNDNVKMNFPMASTVTVLLLGYRAWPQGYGDVGDKMGSSVNWALTYLDKTWDMDNQAIYVQIGDIAKDRTYWQPSNADIYDTLMADNQWPIHKITASNPGSDVAADMATAFATAYISNNAAAIHSVDNILDKAVSLYKFAKASQGLYSDSIPMQDLEYPSYRSTGYTDELCLAAITLYQATSETKYLNQAERYFDADYVSEVFSWDNKYPLCAILLFRETEKVVYSTYIKTFIQKSTSGPATPEGLAWTRANGTLRYTANAAFLALLANEYGVFDDATASLHIEWSIRQINYMLGDNVNQMSYLVGYGDKYPINVFHKSSSCPRTESCGWEFYNSNAENTNMAYGALVGGPDINDDHDDRRQNKIGNSVALDYNAGFQSALAGILNLKQKLEADCGIFGEPEPIWSTPWTGTESTYSWSVSQSFSPSSMTSDQPSPTTPSTPTTPFITPPPTAVPPRPTSFNYEEALSKSMQFYEAQRSEEGGWYDDGSAVKTTIATASATTLLGWGAIKFKDGYEMTNKLKNFQTSIKWSLDYLLQCWEPSSDNQATSRLRRKNVDENKYRGYWARHDYVHAQSPFTSTEITYVEKKMFSREMAMGSDITGETVTAMAIGSIIFNITDPVYSTKLKTAATKMYTLSKDLNDGFNDTTSKYYHGSVDSSDEMCLAAVWLYRATGDYQFVNEATQYSVEVSTELTWSNKHILCQILLYEITGKSTYKTAVQTFLNYWIVDGVSFVAAVDITPGGLSWYDNEGPLRHSANAAFVALLAADLGITPTKLRDWAKSQINYMLGDNAQAYSYQIGYGDRFPRRPHHRTSSCPDYMNQCDWSIYNSPSPNPHELTGALVGGPAVDDFYVDARTSFLMNRVAVDYNAGFQSVLAGLISIYNKPTSPVKTTVRPKQTVNPNRFTVEQTTTTTKAPTQKPVTSKPVPPKFQTTKPTTSKPIPVTSKPVTGKPLKPNGSNDGSIKQPNISGGPDDGTSKASLVYLCNHLAIVVAIFSTICVLM